MMLRQERPAKSPSRTPPAFHPCRVEHLEVGPDGRVPLLTLIDDALRTHPVPVLG